MTMDLDGLYAIRQCLREAHNQILGRSKINKSLILESLDSAIADMTEEILEVKRSNGAEG